MTAKYILDAENNPVLCNDLLAWADWFEESKRRVAYDKAGGVSVSTVFLGLDHAWGNGPPLLWETMIFGGEHDQELWRYSTHAEAIAGHLAALDLIQPPRTPEDETP